ncbi:hypothetical protein BDQ17DRAFT_1364760 [Cyathus striatus]|nr:hypothetical protein BDQ17DRAFT_1364760 [Cyathus striatus]
MTSDSGDLDDNSVYSPTNNNPTGINGHKCSPKNDEHLNELLREKHLLTEHNIEMRYVLSLTGSGKTTKLLTAPVKCQLVLDQLAKNPTALQGPSTIKEGILYNTGVNLTWDYIHSEMCLHDPDGFAIREPNVKRVKWKPLVAVGPHNEWSGHGHDKLSKIRFPIWGMRDKWSRQWLGLWVIPNNCLKEAIAYLYLSLIKKYGGTFMPEQSTTDCGSETTMIFGLATALCQIFSDLPIEQFLAHQFLKSVHNITIERGWLHFLVDQLNSHVIKKNKDTLLSSSMYGGENCLKPVDVDIIDSLMEVIGDETLQFVTPEYAEHAKEIFDGLNVELTFHNIWSVFQAMCNLM